MPGPRRFRFTLAQLLLAAMFLALALGLGLMVRGCAVEPFQSEWLAFSPDGGVLAAGLDDGTTRVWDVESGKEIARLGEPRGFPRGFTPSSTCAASLPDRTTLTTVDHWGVVVRRDLGSGEPTAIFNVPSRPGPAFSPDGKRLAAHSYSVPPGGTAPAITAEVWDVAERRRLHRIARPVSSPPEALAISEDDATLAVAANGEVRTFDLAGGKPLQSVAVPPGRLAFSRDLRRAAAATGDFRRPSIAFCDLTGGGAHATAQENTGWIVAMAFSPDGATLAAADRHGRLRLYDASTGEILATRSGCGDVRSLAFSPEGARVVLSEAHAFLLWRHSAIRFRDPRTLDDAGVVWANDHRAEAGLWLAGFIAWLIAWRRVRRAQRWRRGQPEILPPPGESDVVLAASVEKTPVLPSLKKKNRSGAIWLAVMVLLLAYLFSDQVGAAFEIGFWPAYGLAALFTVLAAGAAFVVAVAVLILLQFLPQRSPEAELNLARQKSGEPGTLVRYGPLTAWFAGECSLERSFQEEFEAVRARHSQLMGRAVAVDQPLLILCFQKVATFHAYAPRVSLLTGYIARWPKRVIVICEDACWEQLGRPGRVLRTLYSHYLLPARRFSFLPSWLGWGAAAMMSLDPDDARRRNRRIRKRLAEGKTLGPNEFLGHNDRIWFRRLQQIQDRDAYVAWWTYRDQAWSFVEFLAGDDGSQRRARFRCLVEAAPRRKDIASLVAEVLGGPVGELFDQWRAWAAVQPIEPEGSVPPPLLEALHARVLPLIRDPQAPLARRLVALRNIAQWGEPEGRAALASLAADVPADLADEVRWALQV